MKKNLFRFSCILNSHKLQLFKRVDKKLNRLYYKISDPTRTLFNSIIEDIEK
jgi:hypothetical protein